MAATTIKVGVGNLCIADEAEKGISLYVIAEWRARKPKDATVPPPRPAFPRAAARPSPPSNTPRGVPEVSAMKRQPPDSEVKVVGGGGGMTNQQVWERLDELEREEEDEEGGEEEEQGRGRERGVEGGRVEWRGEEGRRRDGEKHGDGEGGRIPLRITVQHLSSSGEKSPEAAVMVSVALLKMIKLIKETSIPKMWISKTATAFLVIISLWMTLLLFVQ